MKGIPPITANELCTLEKMFGLSENSIVKITTNRNEEIFTIKLELGKQEDE